MDDIEDLTHGFTIVRYGIMMEISSARDRLRHLQGRPARRALVVLPVVLPCAAHGDVGPDDRSSEGGLIVLRPRFLLVCALAAPLLVGVAASAADARADVIQVRQGESAAEALSRAKPGDTLHLSAGVHRGDLTIAVPGVTIEGEPGAVLQGSGTGSAVSVKAADVTIRGLTIRGSGLSLIDKNSGVFVDRGGDRARIENNDLEDNLIGIYLDGPHDAVVARQPDSGPAAPARERARTRDFPLEHARIGDREQRHPLRSRWRLFRDKQSQRRARQQLP